MIVSAKETAHNMIIMISSSNSLQFSYIMNNRYSPSRLPQASKMLQLIGLAEPSDMALNA